MNYIYFETSAINYLMDNYNDDCIAFMRDTIRIHLKGRSCLSPVSLWEIACTGDNDKKQNLIRICQLLFDDFTLYPDPIQIMDHYISTGCKMTEPKEGFFRYEGEFIKIWQEVARDLEKTIIIGGDLGKNEKDYIKKISLLIRDLVRNNFETHANVNNEYYTMVCEFIIQLYNKLPFVIEDKRKGIVAPSANLEKTAVLFAVIVLIAGVNFGEMVADDFWALREILKLEEMIQYIVTDCNAIIHRGPLVCVAAMAICQVSHKSNRGLFKDCMHAMYLPYCNAFFTNDRHFEQLRELQDDDMWKKIYNIGDFCDNFFERIIPELNRRDIIT